MEHRVQGCWVTQPQARRCADVGSSSRWVTRAGATSQSISEREGKHNNAPRKEAPLCSFISLRCLFCSFLILTFMPLLSPSLPHTNYLWLQTQREENLSFPSVERTPGVLLLWAKPLGFYPGAIDGRCWRGCLSFVFLSELFGEVGHLEGDGSRAWGRDARGKGGRLTDGGEQREATTLFSEKQQLLLVIHCTVRAPPFELPEFMSGAWHFWCGRSVIRQGYVKGSQPTGGWLSMIIRWSKSPVSYH